MNNRRLLSPSSVPAPRASNDATEDALAGAAAALPTPASELLCSLLESAPFPRPAPAPVGVATCLIGVCTADRHPVLGGRVCVHAPLRPEAHQTAEGRSEAWLPVLRGVSVRRGDRVLLAQPENAVEAVVVGVLDGFARQPSPESQPGVCVELKADEVVRIEDPRGRPLIELLPGESGPVVRLLQPDLRLDVDGKLTLCADALLLQARQGAVQIEASDDVSVQAEVIHLN